MSFTDPHTFQDFSLKRAIHIIQSKADPDGLYVEDLIATFGSRSNAFLILFLTLPFVQPVPMLGLSTPLGAIIGTLGVFMALGKRTWLPRRLLRKELSAKLVGSCCQWLIKILNQTEKLIRPRWSFMIQHPFFRFLNAGLICIFAFLLALPLPIPFSNAVPAYFLILNSLGWLEGDGVVIAISYIVAALGFLFFAGLGVGIIELLSFISFPF